MFAANVLPLPVVFGFSGETLNADEEAFFTDVNPLGFILFARNIKSPAQVKKLTERLRVVSNNDEALILIDQEGGRVRRLRPPHWRDYPPMSFFGGRAEQKIDEAVACVTINYRLISSDLRTLGINVNCAPVLDLPNVNSHGIIGDRAFSNNPDLVAKLGRAACKGLLAGGVIPVMKHIPGHGRATVDSHEELPLVDAPLHKLRKKDFVPFSALCSFPAAMTAHIIYSAVDPDFPCSSSSSVIQGVIRDEIGFEGLLFSDDVCMRALTGPADARVVSVLKAGCDIALHCNGDLREMLAIAKTCPRMGPKSLARLKAARHLIHDSDDFDPQAAKDRISAFLSHR